MRTVNGAREWLLAWDGTDADDNPYPDGWEPTKNVSKDLIEQYLRDQKEKVVRAITVDPRPLDGVVQAAISLSVQKGAQDTFGHTQATPFVTAPPHLICVRAQSVCLIPCDCCSLRRLAA